MPDAAPATPEPKPKPKPRSRFSKKWRVWLRALHRDFGYLVVGFTLIYAISGLAVNHAGTPGWDENFRNYEQTLALEGPLGVDEREATGRVMAQLGIEDDYADRLDDETWLYDHAFLYEGELILTLDDGQREIIANEHKGEIVDRGRKRRPFLYLANWLHKAKGKRAWIVIADAYAIMLLFLALSGVFMIPGRKGIKGRGAFLVAIGIAIPVLYVVLSGGPEAASGEGSASLPASAPSTDADPSPGVPGDPEPAGADDEFPAMAPRVPPPADDARGLERGAGPE